MIRILSAASYKSMPWKNGGGTTAEIATSPESTPDWRLSVATIERDGPFSDFAAYDRTIVPIEGRGIELKLDDRETAILGQLYVPYPFAGERRVFCRLIDGTVRDFNVMTRRDAYAHRVETRALEHPEHFRTGPLAFIYVAVGAVEVFEGNAQTGDTIAIEGRDAIDVVPSSPDTVLCVVRVFTPASAAHA